MRHYEPSRIHHDFVATQVQPKQRAVELHQRRQHSRVALLQVVVAEIEVGQGRIHLQKVAQCLRHRLRSRPAAQSIGTQVKSLPMVAAGETARLRHDHRHASHLQTLVATNRVEERLATDGLHPSTTRVSALLPTPRGTQPTTHVDICPS